MQLRLAVNQGKEKFGGSVSQVLSKHGGSKILEIATRGKTGSVDLAGPRVLSMRDHWFVSHEWFVSNELRYQAALRASRVRLSELFRNGTYCS